MDWEKIHEAFQVNEEMIWLNNCGTTPAGNHVVKDVNRFLSGYARKGVLTETARYPEVLGRIKEILSGLLNCQPNEIALIHNTAEGMNFISHGLTFEEGDEVILLENEYPSNVYPWRHLAQKGVKLVTAPMEQTPEEFLSSLMKVINRRTRVISLSAVHWCTGMPLPIERVGRVCAQMGIFLVVDGAQGVGMQPVDVRKWNISFMAFSAWKWLMGPLGLGVLYVFEQNLEKLEPIFVGTDSVVNSLSYLPYKSELKPSADRFVFSTANFIDWVYFLSALKFLDEIGFKKVQQRLFELTDYLNDRLRRLGCTLVSDQFPDQHTAITAFELPKSDSSQTLQFLEKHKIVAAERLGRIRMAPHIFILPRQIDKTVSKLKKWLEQA